jgi:hypothetical protein
MTTDEPKITANAIGVASAVSMRLGRARDHRVEVDLRPDEAGFDRVWEFTR